MKRKESSLATKEEVDQLRQVHRYCRDFKWSCGRASKQDQSEQTFVCDGVVEDEWGIAAQGLYVEGIFSFGKRVKRQKLMLTLSKTDKETRQCARVVQLDVRLPVNRKGKKSDLNWPHIHVGEERILLDADENSSRIDVPRHVKIFEQHANLTFEPELEDPNQLVLR